MSISLDSLDSMEEIFSNASVSSEQNERPLTLVEEATQEIASRILNQEEMVCSVSFDPAFEIIKAGDAFEVRCTVQLGAMEKDANTSVEMIDLLLELSKEAGNLDADTPKMTEKMKDLIVKLKEKGLSILDIDDSKGIDKEMLATLKTTIGYHVDKLRTQIQQIFTKMQTLIQNMSSVNDTIKKMISEQSDLIRKILDRAIKH